MSDLSNLHHTRNYIRLFQMQLHSVLEDMAEPAELFSEQFSNALLKLYDLQESISENDQVDRTDLLSKVQALTDEIFVCVSSMQFLDAKRQRLEHVADGLSYLIEKDEHNMKYDWHQINDLVINQYKMKIERDIYQRYINEHDLDESYEAISEAN